jgi:hypothetical protein
MLDNQIGPEGANALGDVLKDNTTLTSLSLNLAGESSLLGDLCFWFGFVRVSV